MLRQIRGIHHFTYGVGGAQEDYDFHARTLGLRFLKKTALYEGDVPIYHLYYGNAYGDPGTVLTSLPMRQQGIRGRLGANQIARLNLSIPVEAIGFWTDRLRAAGIDVELVELCGTQRLHFRHPCGIPYGMVADGDGDPARSFEGNGISTDDAILGNHGITINVAEPDAMVEYLENGLGAARAGSDGRTLRWRVGETGCSGYVELVETPDEPPGTQRLAEGSVHHCAWDVVDKRRQSDLKGSLEQLGYASWTGPLDRTYFVSVYNRTPSGALFEYCWSKPASWAIDEPDDQLGQAFHIPPMFADREQEFIEYLEPIETGISVNASTT
jgi:glyoxalase family protein